ncbi:hypothetical protein DV515_00016337 [Chloebia gouldiae]|uniref:Uncharacterized protein n=1 Tax=Chloebia gouldiae TaxID=44316 RepID=A0A3L8RUA4_CHLGU|nr:hypothetical protein DV515_00016337 [Chloebia gouldiae]
MRVNWENSQCCGCGPAPAGLSCQVLFQNYRITEYAHLEGTHKDHQVQLLALHRTIPKSHTPLGSCLLQEELGGKGSSKRSCSKCLHFLQDDFHCFPWAADVHQTPWLTLCKPPGYPQASQYMPYCKVGPLRGPTPARGYFSGFSEQGNCKDNFPTQTGSTQDVPTAQVLQCTGGCRAISDGGWGKGARRVFFTFSSLHSIVLSVLFHGSHDAELLCSLCWLAGFIDLCALPRGGKVELLDGVRLSQLLLAVLCPTREEGHVQLGRAGVPLVLVSQCCLLLGLRPLKSGDTSSCPPFDQLGCLVQPTLSSPDVWVELGDQDIVLPDLQTMPSRVDASGAPGRGRSRKQFPEAPSVLQGTELPPPLYLSSKWKLMGNVTPLPLLRIPLKPELSWCVAGSWFTNRALPVHGGALGKPVQASALCGSCGTV